MSSAIRWFAGVSALLCVAASAVGGCSSKKGDLAGDDTDTSSSGDDSGTASSSGIVGASGNGMGGFSSGSSSLPVMVADSDCKGGLYKGTFAGTYTSHLTGVGIPIPVTGDVNLTLAQAGTAGQTCSVAGENITCNNVFALKNGTISGVADAFQIGDAAPFGGFPYFCTMAGTLDCANKKLVGGWIQCTYCVGPLADGGLSCSLLDGVGGTGGVGGYFAGPLVAMYDTGSFSFIMGTWNGAEALAGNDGGSPGPDGGSPLSYLSDSGLYLGPGDFGGSGTWNATYHP